MPDISSVQIPKPLDWQAFQRGCVPLFRKLVDDPTLAEFGRGGQNQQGIDLHGYRSGDLSKPIGVQCRHVETLTFKAIKKAVGQARAIRPALTEIIFATTAKHDAILQREAMELTADLVKNGWNCRITILGWEALQAEIAACPQALQLFWPMAQTVPKRDTDEILAAIQAQSNRVVEAIAISKSTPLTAPLDPKMPDEALSERRDVHERISVYRDLLSDGKTETAIAQLEKMRASVAALEPFARYRIETNIGAAHLRAGRSDEALTHWRAALAMRPDDPKARANVALGLYATGDDTGALALAKAILAEHPAQAGALVVLLQASGPDIDPFTLVSKEAREDADVTASMIAVLRRREDRRWYEAARDALAKHPDDFRFRQWAAEATLEPILSDTGLLIGKPTEEGVLGEVDAAANALLSVWEKLSDDEAIDEEALAALAQNCAAALRFSQRSEEAASVIDKALIKLGRNPALIRIRALLYLHADEDELAVRILGDSPTDPELALLRAEVFAQNDPNAAAAAIDAVALTELSNPIARTAMKLRLELALDLGDLERASSLAEELEKLGEPRAGLALARARIEQRKIPGTASPPDDVDDEDVDEPLLPENASALVESLQGEGVDFLTRVAGAQFLESLGQHEAASNALHGRVDTTRDTVALRTYLGASVSAGMMVRARDALTALPSAISSLPFYKRVNATLLWNTGNVRAAAGIVADLRQHYPQRLDLLLWHIDCLLRLGQEDEVRKIVASINHEDFDGTLSAKLRLARAFVAFGQPERALRFAYRLFLTNRDTPEAWMALMAVVFGLPREGGPDLLREIADEESVIEIKTERGEGLRYSLETDEELRRYTTDAIDVVHPIASAVRGLKPGDTFADPDGRVSTLVSAKNKYLAAFHTALNRYNDRFPAADGLRRVHVEFETPGGLDEMKNVLGARSRHVTDQAKQYAEGHTFLGGLALATGADPVEAMLGLSEVGVAFRVANGFHEEREAAFNAIAQNAGAGCVIDGPTLHIVRRLALESVVAAICGPIGITQATLDNLRERLQMLDESRAQQAGSLSYVNGQLQMRETPPEMLAGARATLRSDIEWIAANAEVLPALPKDEPPAPIRRMDQLAGAKLFDDIFAASGAGRLFVAEDLVTRQLANEMGVAGTWLQPVLMAAKKRGLLDVADYARVLCDLSEIGEDFISVDGEALLAAYKIDCDAGEAAPGRRLRGVMRCIGGAKADAVSHADAVAGFLTALWQDQSLVAQRQAATSAILRQLLRDRTRDYRHILVYLAKKFRSNGTLAEYLDGWAFGHFLLSR